MSKKILFKHKYEILNTQQSSVYGDFYGISSNLPVNNSDYYLLNWSNARTKEYVDYYYEIDLQKYSSSNVYKFRQSDLNIWSGSAPIGKVPSDNYTNTLMKMVYCDIVFTKSKLLSVLDRIRLNLKIDNDEISQISKSIGFLLNHSL